MRFLRSILPNLAISMNIAMLIVVYLDMRNPMMGFLRGTPFVVLVALTCISSIISAAVLYGTTRKQHKREQMQ